MYSDLINVEKALYVYEKKKQKLLCSLFYKQKMRKLSIYRLFLTTLAWLYLAHLKTADNENKCTAV